MTHSETASPKLFSTLRFLIFGFFIFLAFLSPYTGDDWAWGSSIGVERLKIFFQNYNGRYLGNLLVMILTRYQWINIIVKASSFYLACWFCWRYAFSRRTILLLFAFVLFLLMPKGIWVQSVAWTSGFANYVPSALISVSYLLLVRNIFGAEPPEYSTQSPFLLFLLGVSGALFMENITLFNICLGAGILVYTWLRFKKIYPLHVAFLVGALLGGGIMFANEAYRSIAANADSYRSIARSLRELISLIINHAYIILNTLVISNSAFCTITTVLLVLTAKKYRKNNNCSNRTKIVVTCAVALNCVAQIFMVLGNIQVNHSYDSSTQKIILVFLVLASLVYMLSFAVTVVLCIEKSRKAHILFPLLCIPVVVAPLLVVNPIGPRCFFSAYLLLMVFLVDYLDWLLGDIGEEKALNVTLAFCLAVTAAAAAVFYGSIYSSIHIYDVKRAEFAKIQSNNGEKDIIISDLPHPEYLHCSSPGVEPWATRYKLFYDLDSDIQFYFVPYQELDKIIDSYPN